MKKSDEYKCRIFVTAGYFDVIEDAERVYQIQDDTRYKNRYAIRVHSSAGVLYVMVDKIVGIGQL